MITSTSDDPLYRIQREISEVAEREQELRNGYNTPPRSPNNVPIEDVKSLTKSFSTLSCVPQVTKKFPTNPEQKGIMHRFIKSRGKIALTTISPRNESSTTLWTQEATPPKVLVVPGKMLRKGYVPVEEKIQKELREMQEREAEFRAHQRKVLATSQPDLLAILDEPDSTTDSPPPGKLRSVRSINNICDSNENINDTTSPPSLLRPAMSLAQLCDNVDESEVPSSSFLIAKFESIIQQHREISLNNNL